MGSSPAGRASLVSPHVLREAANGSARPGLAGGNDTRTALPAAIAADEFMTIPGTDVYQKPLPVVLICPLVAQAAAG